MTNKMIDSKDFNKIYRKIEMSDQKRNALITESRDIVRESKRAIYSIHRDDLKSAEKHISNLENKLKTFKSKLIKEPRLYYSGFSKIAEQEYVEAVSFYVFVCENRLVTHTELDIDEEHYLLGIIDLTGELVRKAVNSAISKDIKMVYSIKNFMNDLYGELLKFNFSNGELRKKYDSIKYAVNKLEDLVFQISAR
jgi:predicted translin family RNA/ssDNA-binding protein